MFDTFNMQLGAQLQTELLSIKNTKFSQNIAQ